MKEQQLPILKTLRDVLFNQYCTSKKESDMTEEEFHTEQVRKALREVYYEFVDEWGDV